MLVKHTPPVAAVLERLLDLLSSRWSMRLCELMPQFDPPDRQRVSALLQCRPDLFERCGIARYRLRTSHRPPKGER